MKTFLLSCFVVIIHNIVLSQTPSFISNSIDNYIAQGIKDFNILGLAIAIIKDGKPVLMKGYGKKSITDNSPVDENTLFMIASNSKLFTGTALSMLHQHNLLNLNDKVSKYIPNYALYDKSASDLVTIRDVLSHRLGTKTFQGDFTFWNTALPEEEVIHKMRLLKPTQQFRGNYGYCNSGYVTAGAIINKVLPNTNWFGFVKDSIVNRVGMTNTYVYSKDMPTLPNHAKPYTDGLGSLTLVPYDNIDKIAPAGSMISCVKDLSKWLQFQLDSGKINGQQIIPWPVLLRTRDVNIMTNSRKSTTYPTHYTGYALGLFTCDYAGKQVYWHTGGADGYVTNTCFVPEANLGITILTNNDNQSFFEALRYQILDAYLSNEPYVNRAAPFLKTKLYDDSVANANIKNLQATVRKKNKAPFNTSVLLGRYENEIYGTIQIVMVGKQMQVLFSNHPQLVGKLDYLEGNDFLITYNNAAYGVFKMPVVLKNNAVETITIKVNDFIEFDPYVFSRSLKTQY
jgi:CubicO group peptidase (beta-lactamase class C family)